MKQRIKIKSLPPESLLFQLGSGISLPQSNAVFDAEYDWKDTHPHLPEKCAKNNVFTIAPKRIPASGKIPT
jgi:hypothetical protein